MFCNFFDVYVAFHYTWCLCFVFYVLGLDSYVVASELVLNHQKCNLVLFGVAIKFNGLIFFFFSWFINYICKNIIWVGNYKCSQVGLKNLCKQFLSFFGWFSLTLCEVLNPIRGLVTRAWRAIKGIAIRNTWKMWKKNTKATHLKTTILITH
jgi:hypothetical protein